MNDVKRAYLRQLTERARAAFTGQSQDEIERNVDAVVAQARRELADEMADELARAEARDRAAAHTPQHV